MKKERINATGYNVTFAYAVGAWLQYLRERTEGRRVFQSQINRAALALRHIFNIHPELAQQRMHSMDREVWTNRIISAASTPAKRLFYSRVLCFFFRYADIRGWGQKD